VRGDSSDKEGSGVGSIVGVGSSVGSAVGGSTVGGSIVGVGVALGSTGLSEVDTAATGNGAVGDPVAACASARSFSAPTTTTAVGIAWAGAVARPAKKPANVKPIAKITARTAIMTPDTALPVDFGLRLS